MFGLSDSWIVIVIWNGPIPGYPTDSEKLCGHVIERAEEDKAWGYAIEQSKDDMKNVSIYRIVTTMVEGSPNVEIIPC